MGIRWAVILALAALVLTGLGAYAWHRRTTSSAPTFGLLMFAIAGWSLAYALELLSQDPSTKLLWIRFEYLGIVATPVLWLAFALQYAGRGWRLSRRNVALLLLLPLCTLVLVWTNEAHHLFYRQTWLSEADPWPMLRMEYGPWFWVHTVFSYLCILAGTLLLVQAFLRSPPLYRRQTGMLLLGALVPWAGNALYLTDATPWPGLDLTPLAFTLSGLVVAYGLFRYRLLSVVPVARRAVVDGMPTAMIVLDAEGRIADLNPAARRLFGLAERGVIGQPAHQVLQPAELVDRFADVIQADTEVTWGEGGDRRVYRVVISPLGDAAQGAGRRRATSPPARLVLISDVTQEAQARETLAQANRQLLALQQSTAALTALVDPTTLFDRVMDQLEHLPPYQRALLGLYDEATDRLTYVAYRGIDPERIAQAERTAMQRHPGWVVRHKAPLLVNDTETDPRVQYTGPPPHRSIIMVPILYQDQCLGVLGLGSSEPGAYSPADQDLLMAFANQVAVALENAQLYEESRAWAAELEARVAARTQELQKTQAQLLHAEKLAALGRLSASIAHEIGNPLGLLQGYIECLAEEQPDQPYMAPMQNAIERLMGLLAQLHDFARPAAEERQPVAINEVVETVLSLASTELLRSQVHVRSSLASSLHLIEADARQLEQVCLNLALNARDAMPQGGELKISTRQAADQVVIEFADTGVGIPPENLERIFEPYFTTKEDKGTGLGLAICRRIVEAHGGRIVVASEIDGGATFRVYLPISRTLTMGRNRDQEGADAGANSISNSVGHHLPVTNSRSCSAS